MKIKKVRVYLSRQRDNGTFGPNEPIDIEYETDNFCLSLNDIKHLEMKAKYMAEMNWHILGGDMNFNVTGMIPIGE